MEELKLTCAKFFAFSNLSIYCYTGKGEVLFRFPDYYSDLTEDFVRDCMEKIEASEDKQEKPLILTINKNFHLAVIGARKDSILFVGPVAQNPDGLDFPSIYKTYSNRQKCMKMSYEKFINAITLFIQLCTGRTIEATEFISMDSPSIMIQDSFEDSVPNANPGISYPGEALEQRLMTFIEKGNVEGLTAQFALPSYVTIKTMSSDPVRHQKYLFITFMTMAVRAAIKGGLDDEKAFEIVGIYCLRMDKCFDIKEIASLIYNMALSLCREVCKLGIKPSLSLEVRKCRTFIASHLYSPLDLARLAKAANMSTRTLSNRFRQETGTTPMAYVQSARIEEAKFLLHYSRHSILEISNALHFSSQSHFTSVFRHTTGMTPKQFQESKKA